MKSIKKLTFKSLFILTAFSGLLFTSCTNDDEVTPEQILGEYSNGYFLLNEGAFNTGTGTVSFINSGLSSIENDAFTNTNTDTQLGNILQSATTYNNNIYFVVNNAQRIVVANRYTLKQEAVINTQLNNPRYMAIAEGKGYVTNWGDGSSASDDFITVIDLSTNLVETTIPVAEGPEQITYTNGNLFVLHQGGWNHGNKVSVINPINNTVTSEITVGDVPNSLVVNNNDLYVLCGGKPSWTGSETEASLYKINTSTLDATTVSNLAAYTTGMEHAESLNIYNQDFYLEINSKICKLPVDAANSEITTFIDSDFYKFIAIDGNFFGLDAGDFSSNGNVKIYSSTGVLSQQFETGIIPTAVVKNF